VVQWLQFADRIQSGIARLHFESWVEVIEAAHGKSSKVEEMGESFLKIDARLSMCRSFKGWGKLAQSVMRFKVIGRRILTKWNHLSLSVPFWTWQIMVNERKRMQKIGAPLYADGPYLQCPRLSSRGQTTWKTRSESS
jgi:hypothetical protein